MKKDMQVAVWEKKLSPVAKIAQEVEIKDAGTMEEAVVILSKLNKYNDSIIEEKEKITKPLNQALKAERARWNPLEKIYQEAIEVVREKMSVYQTQKTRESVIEAEKIATRVGSGSGKLKVETAVRKIEEIIVPEKEVASSAGLVQFREVKKLKILDRSKIPQGYWMVNEDAVLNALKDGVDVPGAEIETLQIPVNYR